MSRFEDTAALTFRALKIVTCDWWRHLLSIVRISVNYNVRRSKYLDRKLVKYLVL